MPDDDLLIKTNGRAPEAPAAAHVPVCPYCLQDPAAFSTLGPLPCGGLIGVVIFCGNPECRKVWGFELMKPEGRIQPPTAMSPMSPFHS